MANLMINRTQRRKMRVSANMHGTALRPRISVNRSSKYIYAQAIDDDSRTTLASFSSLQLAKKNEATGPKVSHGKAVGVQLAKFLKDLKVTAGIFDRGQYSYKGRVKAIAEGLREGELKI